MKKFSIVLLALALVLGSVSLGYAAGPSGPGYSGDIMGMNTGRYASDPHRTFRLVRFQGNTQTGTANLAAGDIVVWSSIAGGGQDGVTVTTTTTSGDARVAGQMVTAVTSKDAGVSGVWVGLTKASDDVGLKNWGYVQTYGLSTTNATTVEGIATDLPIACGTTAGTIGGWQHTANSQKVPFGFAVEAITAAGTGKIFIKCE